MLEKSVKPLIRSPLLHRLMPKLISVMKLYSKLRPGYLNMSCSGTMPETLQVVPEGTELVYYAIQHSERLRPSRESDLGLLSKVLDGE